MKRYCLINEIGSIKFKKQDSKEYYDIDLCQLIEKILDDCGVSVKIGDDEIKYWFKGVSTEDVRVELKWMLFSNEFILDILDEVYLTAIYLAQEKTEFINEDTKEYNNKIRETIQNRKRGAKKEVPFDLDEYLRVDEQTSANKLMVSKFGLGIVRFWFYSKEFRNLFSRNEKDLSKYETKKIVEMIEKNKNFFGETDYILLERMLGIILLFNFQEWLFRYWTSEELDFEKIIEQVMKYHGEYSRCLALQIIGCNRKNLKVSLDVEKEEKGFIDAYAYYLDEFAVKYNEVYKKMVSGVLRWYGTNYSLETTIELVKKKRNQMKMICFPTMCGTNIERNRVKNDAEWIINKCMEIIMRPEKEKMERRDMIENLTNYLENRRCQYNRLLFFYFEQVNGKDIEWNWEGLKSILLQETILEKMQREIIEGNKERNNKQIRNGSI